MRAVWVNEQGGVTFRVGSDNSGVEFVKVADMSNVTTDFTDEARRLRWAARYIVVPEVLALGLDQTPAGGWAWLRTAGLPGLSAVHPRWLAAPTVAVRAIGAGLRMLHDRLPFRTRSFDCSAASRLSVGEPPPVDQQVFCHGDACAPNTLIDDDGTRVGHVDFGSLGVADRWADLAVAMLSLAGTIPAGCGTPSSSPPTASSPTRCASTTTSGSGRSRMGPTPHAKLEAIRERPERYLCRSPASATPAS